MINILSSSAVKKDLLTPETNPMAVITNKFVITSTNSSFKERFDIDCGDSILDIFSGGDSLQLIYNFVQSEFNTFTFEHLANSSWYNVSIERIHLLENEFFVVIFIYSGEMILIESKINNFHKAIDYGGIPVAITNEKAKLNFVSKAFEDILNSSIDNLFDRHIVDVLGSFLEPAQVEDLQSNLFKYQTWNDVMSFGTNTYYEVNIKAVPDLVLNHTYFIIVANDITTHILAQQQLQEAYNKEQHLNRLKTTFLQNMSHEIRTPLNAVIGYSEFINESIESSNLDEIREFSTSIKDVLKRIMNLFNNIVEISQIESGEISFDKEDINISSVMRGVLLKKEVEANNKKLTLNYQKPSEEILVYSDWVKLEKIFLELVDNAIKYTEQGGIEIYIENYEENIIIHINDTGKGMTENEIPTLLQPFEQSETGYTRANQGAGLGLSIAYKLTILLGGKFYIQSLPNSGTCIELHFPASIFKSQSEII